MSSKASGFTATAVLTLAVGVAGTTVMFALVQGVLLRPLPVREQDRLLGVQGAQEIAQGIRNAEYRAIQSAKGHLAWRAVPGSPQTRFVTQEVRKFLRLPLADGSSSTGAGPATGEG